MSDVLHFKWGMRCVHFSFLAAICLCLTSCASLTKPDKSYLSAKILVKPVQVSSWTRDASASGRSSIEQDGDEVLLVPSNSYTKATIDFQGTHLALKQFVPSDDRHPDQSLKGKVLSTVFTKEKDNPINYCPTWVEGSLFPYIQVLSSNINPAWAYLQKQIPDKDWSLLLLSDRAQTIRFLLRAQKDNTRLHFFIEKKGDSFFMSYADQDDKRLGRSWLRRIYVLLKARCQ